MYLEAAAAAFSVKNIEGLTTLEKLCAGTDRQLLQTISNYKAKLLNK